MESETEKTQIQKIISQSEWFTGLPETAIEQLASDARFKFYSQESYLYRIDEYSAEVYYVDTGRVRISIRGKDGQEFALTDLGAHCWIGDGALLNDSPRVLEAMVVEEGHILVMPRDNIIAVAEQYPVIYRNLFKVATDRAQNTYQMIGYTLFLPLRVRLAGRILEILNYHGKVTEEGVLADVKISQSDFASLALGSRQHINKIFREWTCAGIIKKDAGKYTVIDVDALRKKTA